jgi:hypothetical protein
MNESTWFRKSTPRVRRVPAACGGMTTSRRPVGGDDVGPLLSVPVQKTAGLNDRSHRDAPPGRNRSSAPQLRGEARVPVEDLHRPWSGLQPGVISSSFHSNHPPSPLYHHNHSCLTRGAERSPSRSSPDVIPVRFIGARRGGETGRWRVMFPVAGAKPPSDRENPTRRVDFS